ncbi:MAG: polymerase, partial [Selenomonas sp.]|nr:polymerase [Selenomonas sp.]
FFGSLVLALRQRFLPPVLALPAPTPFDYNEEAAADVELKKVADSVQAEEKKPEASLWQDFCHWEDWQLLGGAALGLGLALISVALNGFTDDLLFNIPSSMLLWLIFAFIAALAELNPSLVTDEPETEVNSAATVLKEESASSKTSEKEPGLNMVDVIEKAPEKQSEKKPAAEDVAETEAVTAKKEDAEAAIENLPSAADKNEEDSEEKSATEVIEEEKEAADNEKPDNHIESNH